MVASILYDKHENLIRVEKQRFVSLAPTSVAPGSILVSQDWNMSEVPESEAGS